MKALYPLLFLLLNGIVLPAQWNGPLAGLRNHLEKTAWKDSSQGLAPLYNSRGLHYLQPVYRSLVTLPADGRKNAVFNYQLPAEDFCFAGDHRNAIYFGSAYFDSLPPAVYKAIDAYADSVKTLEFRDAKQLILSRAAKERVVMLNENPAYAQHRAFAISLLDSLYALGYRYLALEWLNSRKDRYITGLDMRTGYYAAEPVGGELVRRALSLGFRLVPYEDSLAGQHAGSGRYAIQAATLTYLVQHDTTARLLVIAGGARISEKKVGEEFTPMAVFFQRFSGINPLTIDLTEMCEGSAFEYGRYFYQALNQRKKWKTPVVAFRKDSAVSLLENDQYDLQVILPSTAWKHRRPAWLDLGGRRKEVPVRPTEKNLFLVQAYYLKESGEKPLAVLVPADQTYIAGEEGYYWLFLQPGKYKLVLRDMDYAILSEKELELPL